MTRAVDLGQAELDGLLDQLAQIAALGNAGLRGRHEHTDALDIDDNTALVLFGDNAFKHVLGFDRVLDLFPSLAGFQTLLGQADDAFAVVDVHDNSFDLVADLDQILDLGVGVGREVFDRDVSGVLRAQIDFDLRRADRHDGARDLISII